MHSSSLMQFVNLYLSAMQRFLSTRNSRDILFLFLAHLQFNFPFHCSLFSFCLTEFPLPLVIFRSPIAPPVTEFATIRNCEQLSLRWSERQLATCLNRSVPLNQLSPLPHSNPQLSLRSPCAKKLNGLFLPSFRLEWRLARRIHPTPLLIH